MKMIQLVVIAFLLGFSVSAKAQPRKQIDLDAIEIRDSLSGMLYSTAIVKTLLSTGKLGLRINADGKTGVLYELTEVEISRRMENMPKPRESTYFKTGSTIASFKESDMNGNKYNLKEMAGKVVVINFWFINCPPCRQEIPHLNELVEKYKDNKDVVFLAVALDNKYDLQQFLKTSPFNYNIIHEGIYIAQLYSVKAYPTHVVLDKKGKVLFHTSGFGAATVPWIGKSIEAGLNAGPGN
jgi:thiol-disulfide isomerase/thioredoxin